MGQILEFPRPDGACTRGYFADAGPGRPGIVVIQEWWGLNEHICSIADRYADAGFSALAPDLYRGRVASTRDEASHMMTGLDFADATHQDLAGAVKFLGQRCSKLGITGFCMGGALTIAAAVHLAQLSAASCFYGIPVAAFADPANIRIPFQGHFASRDDWCNPAAVDGLEQAMRGAGGEPEIYRYQAEHAFFNQTRPEVFDAACASLAWERSIAFFTRHLGA
ncbi:MAG: dienelactone hydrolase family protein [Betaproteobacteria bacterium]